MAKTSMKIKQQRKPKFSTSLSLKKEKSGEILNGSAIFHLNFWNVQKSRSLGWKLRFIIEIRRSFRLEQTKKEIP